MTRRETDVRPRNNRCTVDGSACRTPSIRSLQFPTVQPYRPRPLAPRHGEGLDDFSPLASLSGLPLVDAVLLARQIRRDGFLGPAGHRVGSDPTARSDPLQRRAETSAPRHLEPIVLAGKRCIGAKRRYPHGWPTAQQGHDLYLLVHKRRPCVESSPPERFFCPMHSLHRHAFREVSRLIHVAATPHRHFVC
jgi:hypothetical protein